MERRKAVNTTAPEEAQILDLLDKASKPVLLNMLKTQGAKSKELKIPLSPHAQKPTQMD